MAEHDDLIDTDELRAFDVVATRRSFSVAAAELGCSQSTISQRIARLEKRLGRQLIRRTTRRVDLTVEGEAMLIYARSILAIAEDARQHLLRPVMKGVLKVGIEDEFATTRLPLVLAIFRDQFPHFAMKFVTGRNEHLHDALRSHEVDIILGKSHQEGGGEVLWQERLTWVGRHKALPPVGEPLPLVTYTKPSMTRDLAEAALLAARRAWVNVAEGSNLLGLLAAAEAGLGVMAIGRSFRTPGIAEIPAEAGLPQLGTLNYVLEGFSAQSDAASRAFFAVLREAAKQTTHDTAAPAGESSGTASQS
ncbi:LysR family transcriptional regulator [Xanthobacter sediminis]|uniref:LysR family transcriptional regulator n=1 Tax=Xanthobacter sediminis TaxID=3119926 RepID=UPI0037282DDE